ncbi:hypothetical protein HBH98_104600 [Parastagonospora nodorum]|nr:hypothetical protein HBH98_104600 [Parastagonospora nodorum]KAH4938305.1 hypothetical protein HBH73_166070 [Parastagonospora nodorum]KAH4944138.1 hypothetical protein HBH74_056810 [Parastagonospora nodorum]KAH5154243.1 hypothetical protein HBI73_062910 [Parastagonospora nodorum]KAH5413106.1 hypothetical protein HBI46_146270 [Parastagonospora nodorum]
MAAEAPQKPIHSLILDTGPLIKNAVSISTIINSAEEIYTTSAIISEIRDEATRSRVQTSLMPFLKIKNPSPASYDAVVAFSKKTGDYAVLSRQDLGILALAYEVHCERNGGPWGLREAPKQPLKMRPGEKEAEDEAKEESKVDEGIKVEEADMHVEDITATEGVQINDGVKVDESETNQSVQTGDEVMTEEQSLENDTEGWSHVPVRSSKQVKEERPKKQKGSAKHKQMKLEKEQRKQARALEASASEQTPTTQNPEAVETDEATTAPARETSEEQTTGGVSIEQEHITQDKSEEQTIVSEGIAIEQEPIIQDSPEKSEEQTVMSEGVAVEQEPITQDLQTEPQQDLVTTTESVESQVSPEEEAEASSSTEPTATEPLSQDFSTLNITTPPSPPATEDEDSDDGDWITPDNLPTHVAADSGLPSSSSPNTHQEQLDVATMTIDFAMQNVLLQMNLHLLSTNMQRVRKLTSKVLRCHACFLTVKDTSRQFCPRCGGSTLKRVNCSTNSKGEFRLHLSKNYQFNKRGDKYAIPKPIAGTANGKWNGLGGGQGGWGRDLILAEDQKEYVKAVEQEKRAKGARDLMDDDYLPGILTGDRSGRAGGRMKVGAGKNVNSKKRHA